MRRSTGGGGQGLLLAVTLVAGSVGVNAVGLQVTEDFSTDELRDPARTTAHWSPQEQSAYLAWHHALYGVPERFAATNLVDEWSNTRCVVVGDVDGDGDVDVIAGNDVQRDRLYLNNGTAAPFAGVVGLDIATNAEQTTALALGDVDGDGDLDLVTGSFHVPIRLYLNDGTADPFGGVSAVSLSASNPRCVGLALSDMDGDGDVDLIVGRDREPPRLYLNAGPFDPFGGVAGVDISVDTNRTWAIAVADMDGDGDADLVAANYGQRNRLYLNNGTASPFVGVASADISTDTNATRAVALGDVDGDGDIDVVAGDANQPVRLYLNNGTAVPFGGVAGSNLTAEAGNTMSVALGDVEGDGDLDVLVGCTKDVSQPLRLYLNNGTAVPFPAAAGVSLDAQAHDVYSIVPADLDGDGDLDVVAGNYPTPNRLYLNRGSVNPFVGVAGSAISAGDQNTHAVALGDLDGDGDLDLAAGNRGQRTRLYLNDGTAEAFQGVAGTDLAADTNQTFCLALGDMDRDGDLDLVAGNYQQPNRLYLNNGGGVFAGGVDISGDTDMTAAVALGDLDGDGHLDVVAGNMGSPSRLYLNNGTANPFAGVEGTDITADTQITHAVALGDVDGDGDLDVVTGNNGWYNRLFLNNGTADPLGGAGILNVGTDREETVTLALADVNRDGRLDVVAGNRWQISRLYLNNGTALPFNGVAGAALGTEPDDIRAVSVGDVDGDGDLDVVMGVYAGPNCLYLNSGRADPFGGVAGENVGAGPGQAFALALGDVDRNGHPDLVTGGAYAPNRLYQNRGASNPFNGVADSAIASADAHDTRGLAVGDVDRDGDLDVVAGNYLGINRLYLSNGTHDPFQGVSGVNISTSVHVTVGIALGDLDSDGNLDVVEAVHGPPNRLYLNNGTAAPFDGVGGTNLTEDSAVTYAVALGDLDGDGDVDVVAGNAGQPSRIYLNNGTAAPFAGVSGENLTADVYNTFAVALGDVDGDGDVDVVTGNYQQRSRLYLNTGTANPFGGVAGRDIGTGAYRTYAVALADLDGDGHLDFVEGNNVLQSRLYLNNGTADPFAGVAGVAITDDVFLNATGLMPGDVDRDGDLDLVIVLLRQRARVYLNNGTADPFAGVSGVAIGSRADDTVSAALADLDGDGALDLVEGNQNQSNRLFRRVKHNTARDRLVSWQVPAGGARIGSARLMQVLGTLPPNTEVNWYLSSNGGVGWHRVRPDRTFMFHSDGTDLRWQARLRSASPFRTPVLDSITLDIRRDFLITSEAGMHGTISPSGSFYVREGSSEIFHVTADTYHHIEDVLINGFSVGPLSLFEWSNFSADGTVHASFAPDLAAHGTPHGWLAGYGLTNGGWTFDEAEENDADADALASWQEYIADTDPTNGASCFRIFAIGHLPPYTVHFQSSTGRVYVLSAASNLVSGVWSNVAGAGPRRGVAGADSMCDTNTPRKGLFYRMKVQLP